MIFKKFIYSDKNLYGYELVRAAEYKKKHMKQCKLYK